MEQIEIPIKEVLATRWRLDFYREDKRHKMGTARMVPLNAHNSGLLSPAGRPFTFPALAASALPLVGKEFVLEGNLVFKESTVD